MMNYFVSDLYALKKMKIVYIVPIILLVMCFLSNFITTRLNFAAIGMKQFENQLAEMEQESMDKQITDSFELGFESSMNAQANYEAEPMKLNELFDGGMAYEASTADLVESSVSGLTYLMLIAIFAAFFYGSQLKGAYCKNILKANDNRWISYTSKVLTVFVYAIILMIFTILVNMLCNAIMCKSFVLGFDGDFFKYIGVQILLTFGMCVITGLISVVSNVALGMVFAIVAGSGLMSMLYMLIDLLVNYVILGNGEFSFSNYLISGNVSTLRMASESGDIIRGIIVAVVFIAVGYFVAGFYNSKRDIH